MVRDGIILEVWYNSLNRNKDKWHRTPQTGRVTIFFALQM
jgi:hypothetical protein